MWTMNCVSAVDLVVQNCNLASGCHYHGWISIIEYLYICWYESVEFCLALKLTTDDA